VEGYPRQPIYDWESANRNASLSDDLIFCFFSALNKATPTALALAVPPYLSLKKDLLEQKRQMWSYHKWDGCSEVLFEMPAPGLKPWLAHGTYLPARHGVPPRKAAVTSTSAQMRIAVFGSCLSRTI